MLDSLKRTVWCSNKSAVTKFWVSRLINLLFIHPLSMGLLEHTVKIDPKKNDQKCLTLSVCCCCLPEHTRDSAYFDAKRSDPLQSMRWTDYHFWLKLKCIMKWKSGMSAVPFYGDAYNNNSTKPFGHGNKSCVFARSYKYKKKNDGDSFSSRACFVLLERKAIDMTKQHKKGSTT